MSQADPRLDFLQAGSTQRLDRDCRPEYLLQSAILRVILATYMPRPTTNGSQSALRIVTHSWSRAIDLSTYDVSFQGLPPEQDGRDVTATAPGNA